MTPSPVKEQLQPDDPTDAPTNPAPVSTCPPAYSIASKSAIDLLNQLSDRVAAFELEAEKLEQKLNERELSAVDKTMVFNQLAQLGGSADRLQSHGEDFAVWVVMMCVAVHSV